MLILRSLIAGLESYSTSFAADENPISEGGRWSRTDTNSSAIKTVGGIALGTQDGTGGFNDSQATLTGFPKRCRIEATIFRHASISSANHEVELCYCTVETSTSTKKYEVLVNRDGGMQFIKWVDSELDNFQDIFTTEFGPLPVSVNDGDMIASEIDIDEINEEVTLRLYGKASGAESWTLLAETIDDGSIGGDAFLTGPPGFGFFIGSALANADHFGFKDLNFQAM